MDLTPTDKAAFAAELERNPRLQTAYDLLQTGMANVAISRELGIHPVTLRNWFKRATVPPRDKFLAKAVTKDSAEVVEERMHEGEDVDEILSEYTKGAVDELKRHASEKEDEVMAELAQKQATPADKYQHYIAAAAIKLLRDSIKNLKGPRTVRELSELDQLIRRNLGLNAKNGGGAGKMVIDISILNNGLADKGDGAVSRLKKDVVEAEIVADEKS